MRAVDIGPDENASVLAEASLPGKALPPPELDPLLLLVQHVHLGGGEIGWGRCMRLQQAWGTLGRNFGFDWRSFPSRTSAMPPTTTAQEPLDSSFLKLALVAGRDPIHAMKCLHGIRKQKHKHHDQPGGFFVRSYEFTVLVLRTPPTSTKVCRKRPRQRRCTPGHQGTSSEQDGERGVLKSQNTGKHGGKQHKGQAPL